MLKMTAHTDVDTIRMLGTGIEGAEDAAFCYVAEDRGLIEGIIFFGARPGTVELTGAYLREAGDSYMLDGLLRAGLNFAITRGMGSYYIPPRFANLCGCSLEAMHYSVDRPADTMRFFDTVKQCSL